MFRLKIALIVIGGILGFFGYQEFAVGRGTTKDPVTVKLGDLEKDSAMDSAHLTIGEHLAVYPGTVYEYETSSAGEQESPDSKVNFAYYPIISKTHPFMKKMAMLEDTYGDLGLVPDHEFPEFNEFTVLVKTKRFKTVGSIPSDDWIEEKAVTGLVINRIKSLTGEERSMIQGNFPKMDLDKALILEEGRTPTSSVAALGMIAGGAVLIALGILSFFAGGRSSTPVTAPTQASAFQASAQNRPDRTSVRMPNRAAAQQEVAQDQEEDEQYES